tara:strand:- start:6131 stop:6727 length:597 start_codon:yes stop_codon:yes gene_type:complete
MSEQSIQNVKVTLLDELSGIIGNPRKFILIRIAGLDVEESCKYLGVTRAAYNKWFSRAPKFISANRRIEELRIDYRQEAVRLLRRDNQLAAVKLEAEVIDQMRNEIKNREYELVKTNLGREVYSKLMAALDVVPAATVNSGDTIIDKLAFVLGNPQNQQLEASKIASIATPENSPTQECDEGEHDAELEQEGLSQSEE